MATQEIKLADWQERWIVVFRPGEFAEHLVIDKTMTSGKPHAITLALDYFENALKFGCKAKTRRGQWRYLRRQYDCRAVRVRFELMR